MKRYSLIILSMLIILTGCGSKSNFSTTFDEFTMKVYDNNKTYVNVPVDTSIAGLKIIAQMKEKTLLADTGFVNSFIVVKTNIQSGVDVKALVESNVKKNQLKLLKYVSIDNLSKKVKCDDMQYSGYITAFSYQLSNEKFYEGQYFFADDESLYIVSLSSDNEKDINSFIKSINTLTCN